MKRIACIAFVLALPGFAQNHIARAVELLSQEKRKEAFEILERAFAEPNPQLKDEAAELLTSAVVGETHEHPGLYAEYLLNRLKPQTYGDRELRWLRLSGDYYLQKARYPQAHDRYALLESKGSSDDKDYAHYKTAWVYLNENKALLAMNTLVDLLSKTKGSKLRLSAAFDLGRFWGESKPAERPTKFFDKALSSTDERKEFFRGLTKTLLLPAKAAERQAMRAEAVKLPDAQWLMQFDLAAKAPTRELACEKLAWSSWPKVLAQVNDEAPYIALTQCFSTPEGALRPLKDAEKKLAYSFIDSLHVTSAIQALHRARFLSNLKEFARACVDYDRTLMDVTQRKPDLCEEALGVCSKGISTATEPATFNLLQNALGCIQLDAKTRALEVVTALYDQDPAGMRKFATKSETKDFLAKSLIPDLLYEKALKNNDQKFAQFIAERFLTAAGAQSPERRKSLEHYLSNTSSKTAPSFEQLRKIYPLERAGVPVVENATVWLKTWQARSNEAPPPELVRTCEAPNRESLDVEMKNFCEQKMDLAKAWDWTAHTSKWNCSQHEALVLRSWLALEDAHAEKIAASPPLRFVASGFADYAKSSFKSASRTIGAHCSGKFVLAEQLRELEEINLAAHKPVRNLNEFSRQLKWLKQKIEKAATEVRVSEKMFAIKKSQLAAVIANLERSLDRLKKEQPETGATLDQFRGVFEKWKKDLS